MADDDRPADRAPDDVLAGLGEKLDTVARALAAIAASHTDLLAHVAEAEVRRSHDAREVAQRLYALEGQVLAIPAPDAHDAAVVVDLDPLRADVALTLDVLARVAEGVERLSSHTDDRLAAVTGSALAPVAELVEALREVGARPAGDSSDAVLERMEELNGRLTLHTDKALAGALRLIDDRLAALRNALADGTGTATTVQANVAGFEAEAVTGAAQAAWNRLEQRLDTEFDDLSRQLQAMASLIEQAVASS